MSNLPDWLPPLVLLEGYAGNWEQYLEALYDYFKKDFIESRPSYQGTKLALKRHPVIQGKEATFWHFISEGGNEADRIPDLRRCERIRWPRPVIENASEPIIKIWGNERKGETRICLWLESQDYLIILAKRKDYILPWTAYLVTQPHQKRKLQQEYAAFKKAGAAP
jgi:hypothetical protein